MNEWELLAACLNDPHPEDWFEGSKRKKSRERTLRVCFRCPVRDVCLEHALAHERRTTGEPVGTFGGMLAAERKRLLDAQHEQGRVSVG